MVTGAELLLAQLSMASKSSSIFAVVCLENAESENCATTCFLIRLRFFLSNPRMHGHDNMSS